MSFARSAAAGIRFEGLEARLALAAVSWDGGAGTPFWHDPLNWSTDNVPDAGDDVTLDVAGTPLITMTGTTGARSVRSLLTREHVHIRAGASLHVGTNATIAAGAVQLFGGALSGGTWTPAGGTLEATAFGGTLTGVSVEGELLLPGGSAHLIIAGGTSFVTARLLGDGSALGFAPGQVLTGTIVLDGPATGHRAIEMNGSAGSLTIAPGAEIRTAPGFGGSAVIGSAHRYGGAMALVNQGLISSEVSGRAMEVAPESLGNSGTMRALSGGVLTIGAASWGSTGELVVTASTLNLGGGFTTAGLNLPGFIRTGGTVNLTGTLLNAGAILGLGEVTGPWTLAGGTIVGGSVAGTDTELVLTASAGTLSGVEVLGDLVLTAASARVNIADGTTFETARLRGAETSIGFARGETLTGTILFEGSGSTRSVEMHGGTGTLTIGPTGQIRTAPGFAGTALVGSDPQHGSMHLVNHGLISWDAPSRVLNLIPHTFVNGPGGSVRTSGGTVSLAAAWTNQGTLATSGGTLRLAGTYATADIGSVERTGGTVLLEGTLTNTGAVLTLNAQTGTWGFGGTIVGGTVRTVEGAALEVRGSTLARLDGVHVDGELYFGSSSNLVTIAGGTTFTLARMAGPGGTMLFEPGQSITGTILVEGTGQRSLFLADFDDAMLTIEESGQILTAAGSTALVRVGAISTNPRHMTLVNRGTLSSAAGSSMSIRVASLTNDGAIRTEGGWVLVDAGAGTLAGGSITVGGGTLVLAGTLDVSAGIGSWSRTGGVVELVGTLVNTGGTLTLSEQTGSWVLRRGVVAGGTLVLSPGHTLTFTVEGGTLSGVTVVGELHLAGTQVRLTIDGGTMFPLARLTGDGSFLYFAPGQTITGTVLLDGLAPRIAMTAAGTLTIGPTGELRTGPNASGTAYVEDSDMDLVNEGTIASEFSTGFLTLKPATLANMPTGVVRAANGATIELWATTMTNTGLLAGVTGTLMIRGLLDSTGATQTLNDQTGSWVLYNGGITGGQVNIAPGYALIIASGGLIPSLAGGVVVNGELLLPNLGSRAIIAGGATFATARLRGESSRIEFAPDQVLTGTIVFEGPGVSGVRHVRMWGGSGVLEIGPTGRIMAGADFEGEGQVGTTDGLNWTMELINRGTIESAAAAGTVWVRSATMVNRGVLRTGGGGTLRIWPTGTWSGPAGLSEVSGGTLVLGGAFDIRGGIGEWVRTGGTVEIAGTLDNTGAVLAIDANTGSFDLRGGTITGGTLIQAGGYRLVSTFTGGLLDGVTVNDELLITQDTAVRIGVGTTFPLARLAGSGSVLLFSPGAVITGDVVFEGPDTGPRWMRMYNHGTVTVTPTGRIMTAPGFGGWAVLGDQNGYGMNLVNNGLISIGGGVLAFGSNITNAGVLRVTDGASLTFSGTAWDVVDGTLTQGTWHVGDGSTLGTSRVIFTNAATVTLEGSAVWPAAGFIRSNSGTLRLLGGRDHAASEAFSNSGTLVLSPGSVLSAPAFTQTSTGSLQVQVAGVTPAQIGRVTATGSAALAGALEIVAVGGYTPEWGDTAQFISGAAVSGSFGNVAVPPLAPGLKAPILYSPAGVRWLVTSIADIDEDGTVNSTDISFFLTAWLNALDNGTLEGDFNGDGVVNSSDISAFLTVWLEALL